MNRESPNPPILVAVATYNEIDNLPRLVDEIASFAPEADVLVVDDGSPDGTGRWCDGRAEIDSRVRCLHRPRKMGLGSATIAAFRYAIERQYDYVVTMDADLSHPPSAIPTLLAAIDPRHTAGRDVVIGSRYVRGGAIRGWPVWRHVVSRLLNLYARLLLALPTKDCSGAFRCYRIDRLKEIDFDDFESHGYAFLEELLWHLRRIGCSFGEVPIEFVNRLHGQSKINLGEARNAVWVIFRLGVRNWLTRS